MRHASDSVKEIEVLKEAINQRQIEFGELDTEVKKILLKKCEQVNLLQFRDFQLK
jgi:hypothetical protein